MLTYVTFKKTLPSLRATIAIFLAISTVCLVPLAASASTPIASCRTADGKEGVKVAIAAGGLTCVPIGGNGLKENPIFIYITSILKVVSALAGLACLGGFVWGTLMYTTARANAGQVEKARMVMLNAIIGLLLFIFMYAILQFLVPGGVFT